MHAPVRTADGRARLLPHEYIPTDVQPRFAPEQVVAIRRSNCRTFCPLLAQWHDEQYEKNKFVFKKVGQAVTITLRHFGRLPE
eukprot:7218521-Alexandrium_andersonii.AAC.1